MTISDPSYGMLHVRILNLEVIVRLHSNFRMSHAHEHLH